MRYRNIGISIFVLTALAARCLAAQTTDVIGALIDAAAPGSTITVPAGVYQGHLRITKGVVLDGHGAVTIDGGGEGTVVELLAPNTTLRGFTISGSGAGVDREPAGIRAETGPVVIEDNVVDDVLFGIDLRTAPDSIVRNNLVTSKHLEAGRRGDGIRLWWSHNCTIEDNSVHRSRDMVFWYSEGLHIRGNHVTDSRYGLHFMYSHDTTLEHNTLDGNSVGIYLMYSNRITVQDNVLVRNRGASGYGLGLKDCDDIVVRNNAMLANRVGIYIDNSPSSVDSNGLVEHNAVQYNEIGFLATPNTHNNDLTENAFIENEQQVAVHGKGDLAQNHFARDGRGNFWSDYAGFDLQGDGIGDLPYESRNLFESLLATDPNLRIFVNSPAQQAVEFAGRALPQLQPNPSFTDPSPLVQRPVSLAAGTSSRFNAAMGFVSLILLCVAGAGLWLGAERGLRRKEALS
ncbi:MAG: nitrous oxide reductase family maturation protein NosD [Phycisphaerales bacterium]|nr:nitrous oxide reductase family maturation protein NosD [Phycisphaerales bacterium]